jgi:hypothetical protein
MDKYIADLLEQIGHARKAGCDVDLDLCILMHASYLTAIETYPEMVIDEQRFHLVPIKFASNCIDTIKAESSWDVPSDSSPSGYGVWGFAGEPPRKRVIS